MIETRDLTKKYDELFAVKSLSIKLDKGDVFGFIGPNGAGKTTTMRMLATLLNPTWGEAYVSRSTSARTMPFCPSSDGCSPSSSKYSGFSAPSAFGKSTTGSGCRRTASMTLIKSSL